ncbi:MAG: CPBP family intramembrane glutamic endopeptidase, partial [Planctomycetota bacterium]
WRPHTVIASGTKPNSPANRPAWGRHQVVETFRLRACNPLVFLGATLMGFSLWVAAHELLLFGEWIGLGGLNESAKQSAKVLDDQLQLVPLWLVLLTISATPAIFEELCFRGFLFSAMEATGRRRLASNGSANSIGVPEDRSTRRCIQIVAVTAIAFGAFHLVGSVVLIERLLPSTMMGLFIGWVAWRSHSIWPGILVHLIHNGLIMVVARHKSFFEGLGLQANDDSAHFPATWMAGAAIGVILGTAIVWLATREKKAS